MVTDHPEIRSDGESVEMDRAGPAARRRGLIVLITGFNLTRLVTADSPRDPWESMQVMEGWQYARDDRL